MSCHTLSFYCPAHLYLFPSETVDTLFNDVDLYDDKDRWDAALVQSSAQYAALFNDALQRYANGALPLVDDAEYCDITNSPASAHCTLIAESTSLWLKIEYPTTNDLSSEENLQIKKQIAASIETEISVSQWGIIDRPEGALVVIFEPVKDWSFSTNGYQPKFTDLLEDNHILTRLEWEAATNQLGEKFGRVEVEKNQARIYADMPDCVRLLSALEKELGGNSGSSADWLRTVYELNDDFEEAPIEATKRLCSAFQAVQKSYGTAIANALYNAQSIVLASELIPAAMYLHCGGDMETAKSLADSGFFMESYDYDRMKQAAQFMADGGAANDAYSFISQNKKEDSPQEDASGMTMAQSL